MATEAEGTANSDIDAELGERWYGGAREAEEALTGEIVAITRQFIKRRFDENRRPAMRDAHATDNGCVRATFAVDPDLDPALRHGVFVPGAQYKAYIRFSNGNSERLSNRRLDARGMAIKLVGVPGTKLLEDEKQTQDFILVKGPVFFVDDLVRYRNALQTFHAGGVLHQNLALLRLRGREILLSIINNSTLIDNPLFSRYWSKTPYRLGVGRDRAAIKFMVRPRLPAPPPLLRRILTVLRPSFSLKTELQNVLAVQPAEFDFYIQRYVDETRTPIEDSKTKWQETVSRPQHVARIVIPPQRLISKERDDFCENLSFSPWHALAEHKPLGAVNRVRKQVYLQISNFRHSLNGVAPKEPAGDEEI